MKIETLAVHAGRTVDPSTGAVSAPIHLSTTFEREIDGSYPRGHMYSRNSNPNRNALEAGAAALEGGAEAAAFSSGMSAAMTVFQALRPEDHLIAHTDAYYGMTRLLQDVHLKWNFQADFVDMSNLEAVRKALRPNTRLVWTETPSNPLLKIVDLAAVAEIAHGGGALAIADNTWAPVIQRPLDLGIDLVLHSTTKYFGGHCDVLGGMLVTRAKNEFWERIRQIQYSGGAVPSPFDCWLVHRGMQTLPWRMRAHCQNASMVAAFLEKHPKIDRAHYPGLSSHPQHQLAMKQMSLAGGMLSIEVKGGAQEAVALTAKVKFFTRATSLGGVESLIEHRASVEGPGTTSPPNLLRLSIGLENADDLIEDLQQALG